MQGIGGFAFSYDALRCTDARVMLENFIAQETMREKIAVDEYDKLVQALAELSKSANNFGTNPKFTEVTPASDRLRLRNAQTLIKQAEALIVAARPA